MDPQQIQADRCYQLHTGQIVRVVQIGGQYARCEIFDSEAQRWLRTNSPIPVAHFKACCNLPTTSSDPSSSPLLQDLGANPSELISSRVLIYQGIEILEERVKTEEIIDPAALPAHRFWCKIEGREVRGTFEEVVQAIDEYRS